MPRAQAPSGWPKRTRAHLHVVIDAIDKGADIHGHFASWLPDKWEWGQDFPNASGIVDVDNEIQKWTPKANAMFYADVIRADALPSS